MRIFAQSRFPLEVKEYKEGFCIVISGTDHNIMHNNEYVFVVYDTKEDAEEALKYIYEMRKIKYRMILKEVF